MQVMFVQIDYNLSFTTSFHLGTGIRDGLVDRTVIRDKSNDLYVPASTFKGVLREHCEQLLRFYTSNDQESAISPHNRYAALGEFVGKLTLISRIFGSSFYPGRLRFHDARQGSRRDDAYKAMQTSISTQVRINRITRTAASEALYSSEFGTRDLSFTGSIKGQLDCIPIPSLHVTGYDGKEEYTLTPTYSLLLLLAGLLMIERIGGNKSAGKGQCNCSITELTLDRHECLEEQWQSWIEHLDVLSDYQHDEEGT